MSEHKATWVRLVVVSMFVLAIGQDQPGTDAEFEQDVPTVPGDELLPLIESTRSFRIVSGDGAGDEVTQTLRRTEEGEPGEWVLQLSDLNVLYLRRDEQGATQIIRMDLPRENRALVYEPAVRAIPARLHPRLSEVGNGIARVYNLESGEKIRIGKFRHEIEEVARSRFATPSGPVQGFLVVLDHSIDVDFGEVRLALEAGYVPGEGMVYRHMRYTKKKLWLFGETIRRTAVLTEPAGSADERSGPEENGDG